VDDFSTDNTLEILTHYKNLNSSVKIVNRAKNGGLEAAIKDGISVATGEFFFLMGHDDYLSVDLIASALHVFERNSEIDAVRPDLYFVFGDGKVRNTLCARSEIGGIEAIKQTIGKWETHTFCVWKREIFTQLNDVTTDNSSNFDEFGTRFLFSKCRLVSFCSGIYYYVQYPTSLTRNISLRRVEYINTAEKIKQLLIDLNLYESLAVEFQKDYFFVLKSALECLVHARRQVDFDRYEAIFKAGYSSIDKEKAVAAFTGPKKIYVRMALHSIFLFKILLRFK